AAPGSKTSQIAQYMNNDGILVANDVKGLRLAPLGINVQRMGISNCVLTLMKGEGFKDILFDKILLDAPCSGTGTIRKSLKTIDMWNPGMIKRLAAVQRRLITTAWGVLKQGGRLVYSTCSSEPEENEAIIDFLLKTQKDAVVEKISLSLNHNPAITEFEGEKYDASVKNCLRLWPQDNDTEGFFVASVRKE
ncbi:RsmB/NOP family class I SAM-dependent RNA methyltransferase, partial [Candidatus Woesearchaeota archaeon]|nr:RsmB/NOP family class I SAM-dependent RNA methyltransferase [Candidatus Woesearchaeota archaeon]